MQKLDRDTVGNWADTVAEAARRYLSAPVLWCPASRCWVEGNEPYAPLDPALWRVRISEFLYTLEYHTGEVPPGFPEEFDYAEPGKEPVPDRAPIPHYPRLFLDWWSMGRQVRHASGPITRDLKEILSGFPEFRRESAMTPERWLSLCAKSEAAFTSSRDLIAAFRKDCPDAAVGEHAFLALARNVLGRDGRFGPKGARGSWGFRAHLPR